MEVNIRTETFPLLVGIAFLLVGEYSPPHAQGTGGSVTAACAKNLEDQSSGNCNVKASRTPTLGMLYPLTEDLFVHAVSGFVGVGTTNPFSNLHVDGDLRLTENSLLGPALILEDNSLLPDGLFLIRSRGGVFQILENTAIGGDFATRNRVFEVVNDSILMGNGMMVLDQSSARRQLIVNGDIFLSEATPLGPALILEDGTALPNGRFLVRSRGGSFQVLENTAVSGDFSTSNTILHGDNGKVGILTSAPSTELDVNGTITAETLVITGGSDIAEPFEVVEEGVELGMVVSIDPERPGKLRLSNKTYDCTVAGVVSGAGGVQPGITLTQDGFFEGSYPIALSGRVYVKCSTENGPIRPGDMLTTASMTGYAMKATDRERSFGAVLGKAMSSLVSETGLVLILVNLQ